eukprot:scaffold2280_cov430-Prasinococcus_capsulatus_cf.AAC.22
MQHCIRRTYFRLAVRFTYKDVSLREDYRHHYSQNMEYVIAFVPCPNTGRRDDIVVRRALEDMERGARSASFGVNSVDPPGTRWREALLQGEYTSGNATTRLPDFLPRCKKCYSVSCRKKPTASTSSIRTLYAFTEVLGPPALWRKA